LLALLDRAEIEPTSGKTVADITSGFLEQVTATPGKGICFADEGWYPRTQRENAVNLASGADEEIAGNREERLRKGLHNRILSNVTRKLGAKVVDDKGLIGEWAVKVFRACPEIVAGWDRFQGTSMSLADTYRYWPHSALAIEPRLNARWMATMAYIGRVISLPPPPISTFRQPVPRGSDIETPPPRSIPPALEVIVESVLPAPLTKQHLTKGLSHADGLVQYMTALTLARGLQKLDVVQQLFREIEAEVGNKPSTSAENPWATIRRELELDCRRRVPEVQVIIAFAQKAATLPPAEPETDEDNALVAKSTMLTEVALRLFGLYHRTLPSLASEVRFDVGRLLVSSSSNKAERRERQLAKVERAGSVLGETGSVASVGTAGTAGMGGGFGHARGDVQGFEALSQVHVVQLLSEVQNWQWTNKAGKC
jgi:nucleolar pre-ribosomal-associated protein 1